MAGDSLWLKDGKIIVENGKAIICKRCPCECRPRVIKNFKVSYYDQFPKCFDFTPYQGKGIGTPGYIWFMAALGEFGCGRYEYWRGNIDDEGVLVGLKPQVCFTYYPGDYISLQEGCYDENGMITWPDTCKNINV